MPAHSPLPLLQAIVLCDCIYSDARTGKKVLAGTFNTLWAVEFPTVFARSTFVYLCVTEVHREATLGMRYVDLDTNDALLSLDGIVLEAESPVLSVELAIEIPPLPMPHAGPYAIEVVCGDSPLGSVRMLAQKIAPPPPANGHTPR